MLDSEFAIFIGAKTSVLWTFFFPYSTRESLISIFHQLFFSLFYVDHCFSWLWWINYTCNPDPMQQFLLCFLQYFLVIWWIQLIHLLQITWDEPEVMWNARYVNPWQVEVAMTNSQPFNSVFLPTRWSRLASAHKDPRRISDDC